jgi:hypothetical protein
LKSALDATFDEGARERETDATKLERLVVSAFEAAARKLLVVLELHLHGEPDADPIAGLADRNPHRTESRRERSVIGNLDVGLVDLRRARLGREGIAGVGHVCRGRTAFSGDLEGSLPLFLLRLRLLELRLDAVEVAPLELWVELFVRRFDGGFDFGE